MKKIHCTPLPHRTHVDFELSIAGQCPEGSSYSATCHIWYSPTTILLNVAGFQTEYGTGTMRYAEELAHEIFEDAQKLLGPGRYLVLEMDVTESEDHGPIHIRMQD